MKRASKGNKPKFKSLKNGKRNRHSSQKGATATDLCINEADLDLKELLEKHSCQLKPKESASRSSKLSPTLVDILKNPMYIGYFMEFLELKAVKHLADFWLVAETFHMVAGQNSRKAKSERRCQLGNGENVNERTNSDLDLTEHGENTSNNSYNHFENESKDNSESWCDQCRELRAKQYGESFLDRKGQMVYPVQNGIDSDDNGSCKHCGSSGASKSLLKVQFQNDWQPFSLNGNSDCSKLELSRVKYSEPSSEEISPYRPLRRVMTKETRLRTKSTVVDAIGIYTKYVSLDAEIPIGLPSDERRKIEAEICVDTENIDPECFLAAQDFVLSKLEEYLKQFMESSFGSKYQLSILENSKLTLQDILYSDTASFYFTEFLERERSRTILEFWLIAEGFEQNLSEKLQDNSYIAAEALEDAMSIYEKYFSMCAPIRLIRDDKLRIVTENNICSEDGPQPNCFCIPMAYAWTALKELYLPRFLESDIYFQFLENLYKNSITDRSSNDESCSITSSDSRDDSEGLMLLSEDFLDKDLNDMWYRPAAGRLALGHVDELGIFIPEMEPEPEDEAENSSVSKLGKRMRSLLVRESVADKERAAWEKARKIIADVQKHNK